VPLDGLSRKERAAVQQALAPCPEERPQDRARAWVKRLYAATRPERTPAPEPPPPQGVAPPAAIPAVPETTQRSAPGVAPQSLPVAPMVAPGKPEYGAAQPQNAGPPANELGCATAGLAIGGAIFDAIEGLAKAAGRNRGPHDEHLTPGIEPSNGDGHSSQRK